MPNFGKTSKQRLETCHKDLQTICNEVIKYYDFSVIEGHRTLETQQKYFKEGKSKLDGINQKSKHQGEKIPKEVQSPHNSCYDDKGKILVDEDGDSIWSTAVDIMPYKKGTNAFKDDNKERARFYHLAGYMFMASEILYKEKKISYKLRWGGDWNIDNYFNDQSFDDLPHFELVKV